MKRIFSTLFFVFFSISAFSQVKLSGYTEHILGVEINASKKMSLELRFKETRNRSWFDNEALLFYQVFHKDYYGIKIGAGIDANFINEGDIIEALVVPVQFEVVPFKKYDYFSLVVEPSVFVTESDSYLRNLVGIKIRL